MEISFCACLFTVVSPVPLCRLQAMPAVTSQCNFDWVEGTPGLLEQMAGSSRTFLQVPLETFETTQKYITRTLKLVTPIHVYSSVNATEVNPFTLDLSQITFSNLRCAPDTWFK